MKVLVTGGTGVIGEGLVAALLRLGHEVRLLARGAEREAPSWPSGVEPWTGDVTKPRTLKGAADGCGAVLHVTGIVREEPPGLTFEKVNVGGTRNMLREAERAGVPRFIYVSSLGADRGRSGYHRSKLAAEKVARTFGAEWTIVRPGNVYGPGDEVVSWLLKMMRTLPAVPMVGGGKQPFEPVWYEDVGEVLARCVDARDVVGRVLELAGPDRTSAKDLVTRLSRLTHRRPMRIPVPLAAARAGLKVAQKLGVAKRLGISLPIGEAQLTMLDEGNVLTEGATNALDLLHVTPTRLDDGLARLVDLLPEQLPQEGVGALRRKRYRAEVMGATSTAAALQRLLRHRIADVMPLEVGQEKGAPQRLSVGTTFSVTLPVRGVISMRVVEVARGRITAATVGGHPLAGVVRFKIKAGRGRGLHVEVEVHARSADVLDGIVMSTVGSVMQDSNWRDVVERLVALSGGEAPEGVSVSDETLEGAEAAKVEKWVSSLVARRRKKTHAAAVATARPEERRQGRHPRAATAGAPGRDAGASPTRAKTGRRAAVRKARSTAR